MGVLPKLGDGCPTIFGHDPCLTLTSPPFPMELFRVKVGGTWAIGANLPNPQNTVAQKPGQRLRMPKLPPKNRGQHLRRDQMGVLPRLGDGCPTICGHDPCLTVTIPHFPMELFRVKVGGTWAIGANVPGVEASGLDALYITF